MARRQGRTMVRAEAARPGGRRELLHHAGRPSVTARGRPPGTGKSDSDVLERLALRLSRPGPAPESEEPKALLDLMDEGLLALEPERMEG